MTAQEIAQELRQQARLYDKVAEILDPIENYKPKNPYSFAELHKHQVALGIVKKRLPSP